MLILALSMLLLFSAAGADILVSAPDISSSHNRFTYISKISSNIGINGSTVICSGKGQGKYNNTSTVMRVILQKRASGTSTWSYVCAWTQTGSGNTNVSISESKSINSGYDYRILTKCTILDSNGNMLETASQYSGIVSY